MKLSETIKKVIALAETTRDYWDTELPKRHPNYPLVNPGEDSPPPPPEEKKLKHLLQRLPEEDVYKVALIMHLGRGDFGTNDLAGNYEELKKSYVTPDWAADRMVRKADLADYLLDGLAELEKNGMDVDHLSFASVSAGGTSG